MHDTVLDDCTSITRRLGAQRRDSFGKQEGSIWLVSSIYRSELDALRSAYGASGLWEFLEQIYPSCQQLFEQLTNALSLTKAMDLSDIITYMNRTQGRPRRGKSEQCIATVARLRDAAT